MAPYLRPALDIEDDLNAAQTALGQGGFNLRTNLGAPVWNWSAIASWVSDWTAAFQADETAAGLPAVYPVLYMNRSYAAELEQYLDQSGYSLWIVASTTASAPVIPPPPYTVSGGGPTWSPSIWPWAIEQYNQTGSGSPPGDWDAMNPSYSGNLMIGQGQARVTGVSSTEASGTYPAGTAIPITVTFNQPITVNGTPQLALNVGCGATATYTSGSGTAALIFTYTVAAGQNSSDLDYTSIAALALKRGTIEDGSGNAATLTLPTTGTDGPAAKNIVIDTTLTVPASALDLGSRSRLDPDAGRQRQPACLHNRHDYRYGDAVLADKRRDCDYGAQRHHCQPDNRLFRRGPDPGRRTKLWRGRRPDRSRFRCCGPVRTTPSGAARWSRRGRSFAQHQLPYPTSQALRSAQN